MTDIGIVPSFQSYRNKMSKDTTRNKTIAKNTAMLYIRMLVTMAIGLYTSRVVLEQLGVDDYGIYNVIGGIVAMFSIISASLSTSISRFLTFELGKGNDSKLNRIFSTAIIIQAAIGCLVLILGEIIGVWFIYNKMTIPADRLTAANWVLQCSLATFLINMISLPYNATIIAHEKMQAFAFISFLEAFLKLGVAFSLFITPFDTLKTYAVLITVAALVVRVVYSIYCKSHFKECYFRFIFDKSILKEMLSFSGWNFIGSTSGILKDQGVNVLMNIFCGPAVNAARGISSQINSVITSFSSNFMLATNPQIIKSYAAKDYTYMMTLIRSAARFSFYMLLVLSLPIIINAPFILHKWLTIVPDYTVHFVRLILTLGMIESLSIPLQYANQATGNIKLYQITVGGLQLLNFPISYILLKAGIEPECTYLVAIIIGVMCLFARLIILKRTIKLDIQVFITKVCLNVLKVGAISVAIPILILVFIDDTNGWGSFSILTSVSLLSTALSIIYIGCNSHERKALFSKIHNFILSRFSNHA